MRIRWRLGEDALKAFRAQKQVTVRKVAKNKANNSKNKREKFSKDRNEQLQKQPTWSAINNRNNTILKFSTWIVTRNSETKRSNVSEGSEKHTIIHIHYEAKFD